MANYRDMTGQRFGMLTAVELVGKNTSGRTLWKCKCDCGNEKIILQGALHQGLAKSCGCMRHHLRNTRLYTIWSHMQQRCENKNHNRYKYYGARGICICDEWRSNFVAFYNWAQSNGYADNLTIDRVNVDGNYEPSNCRWIPASEQSRNRRPFHHIKGVK